MSSVGCSIHRRDLIALAGRPARLCLAKYNSTGGGKEIAELGLHA